MLLINTIYMFDSDKNVALPDDFWFRFQKEVLI
jgi:hypothetical protein